MPDLRLYAALCQEGEEHDAAWRLLSLAVRRDCGVFSLPSVEKGPGGKPFFPSRPDLCFNLSHSHGAVVCALSSTPVGVDVEKLRPAPHHLARDRSDSDFFHRWTGQEASLKREGRSASLLLHRDPEPDPLCQWFPTLLPGYIICLCPSAVSTVRGELLSL